MLTVIFIGVQCTLGLIIDICRVPGQVDPQIDLCVNHFVTVSKKNLTSIDGYTPPTKK